MARQARRAAELVPGASLRGLVFDSCYDNRIPNTFGMLRHFGMPNRNRVLVSESPHLNTTGLATALRIDETEVLRRRYPPFGRGHRSFHGLHILKERIEDTVRRFSPAAINAGYLHHPATHELRDLPFSTVGWDMLQDTCPCTDDGIRQNWITVNGSSRCHSCGANLGKVTSVPVPDDLRRPLAFIAGLVDPDPAMHASALDMLPTAIRGASRTLLYDMVMNVARAIGADPDGADPEARTETLAQACDIVIRWPKGLADIRQAEDCPDQVWSWIRRNYAILDVNSQVVSLTAAAVGTHPMSHLTYAPSGSAGKTRTGLLGAMAAARLGGVDESALKKAWDDGQFTQHVWVRGSLRVRAFDPLEVVAVAPTLRLTGSRAQAAAHLGLPMYGLEMLLEQGIFCPASPGAGVKQCAAHLVAARQLAADLGQRVTAIADPISFIEAIRHVSGRMKPWGAAFAAMLAEDLPFSLSGAKDHRPVANRLQVSTDAIPFLLAWSEPDVPKVPITRVDRWTQGDAIECLNGYVNSVELLNGLEATGTGKKRLFAVADILDRAANGVTTSDIARRSGNTFMQTAMALEAGRVPQIAPGFWLRKEAELVVRPRI